MRKQIAVAWTLSALVFGLSVALTQAQQAAPPTSPPRATPRAPNTPPPGFTALFNGQDLAGWKGLVADPPKRAKMTPEELARAQQVADKSTREHWAVQDGVLVFDGKGENLCTARDFGDFELFVDWRIEKGGDSGIYLRGSPQVQIWDNPLGSGGLYNNQKHASNPLFVADKPLGDEKSPGAWNTFRILMRGERVTVYLNDILVVDDTPLENYWERDKSIYASGAIELQNHGGPLWFRNIYVRELPSAAGGDAAIRTPHASARPASQPAAGLLQRGDRVAIVGDSITEQKLYSRFIEDYLTACLPQLDIVTCQFGWGGEWARGFAARMDNDLLPWKPTVVTTCYGMNDGGYKPYAPEIGQVYADAMRGIAERLGQTGVRVIAVGSPGAVDTFTFKKPDRVAPEVYNDNLGHLRDIARELAWQVDQPFADVHDQMILAMLRAKPQLGAEYPVCGRDGFHPSPNGQLVMAYAFLKALGCDGQLGTIMLEWGGAAQAAGGHKVLASTGGRLQLESTQYPFCFYDYGKGPDESTRGILPFVPFNADLNRLTLVVKNLPGKSARVSWRAIGDKAGGGAAAAAVAGEKTFTSKQLEAGINLAAEFLDNPFSDAFRKVDEAVARKQAYETQMIKEGVTWFRSIRSLVGADPADAAAMDRLRGRLFERDAEQAREVRALVTPVRHEVLIEPLE